MKLKKTKPLINYLSGSNETSEITLSSGKIFIVDKNDIEELRKTLKYLLKRI